MSKESLLLISVGGDERCSMPGVVDKALVFRVRDWMAVYAESAGLCLSPRFPLVPAVGACHFFIEPIGVFSFLFRAPHPELAGGNIDLFGVVAARLDARLILDFPGLLAGK